MDKELKEKLDWMNENLNAIVRNQAEIFMKLKEIEKKLPKQETNG